MVPLAIRRQCFGQGNISSAVVIDLNFITDKIGISGIASPLSEPFARFRRLYAYVDLHWGRLAVRGNTNRLDLGNYRKMRC